MSDEALETFECTNCSKRYRWKAELSGKRVRCACGATVNVPLAQLDESDDLYDFKEEPPQPVVPIRTVVAAPTGAAEMYPPSSTLNYRRPPEGSLRRDEEDKLTDVWRDWYVPAIMLGAGFLLTILWGAVETSLGSIGMVFISIFYGIATLIKTGILIGLALALAPTLGVSFGLLRTAVLKFAALIILSDSVLLWIDTLMRAAGATSSNGRYVLGSFTIALLVTEVIVCIGCYYLFSMDSDEIRTFAMPMALVSRVISFAMKIVIIAVLSGIIGGINATARPRPAYTPMSLGNPAPAATTVTPASSVPMGSVLTASSGTPADIAIADRINKHSSEVKEARAWMRAALVSNKENNRLILDLYYRNAQAIYVDMGSALQSKPRWLYVQLPTDPERRNACTNAVNAYCNEHGLPPVATPSANDLYMTVPLVN